MTKVEPERQPVAFSGSLVWPGGTCGAYRRCKRTEETLEGSVRINQIFEKAEASQRGVAVCHL